MPAQFVLHASLHAVSVIRVGMQFRHRRKRRYFRNEGRILPQ
jgi:hypothetical protein